MKPPIYLESVSYSSSTKTGQAHTVTKPVVIVVEGKEDKAFFEGLIKFLGMDNVQVDPIEGVGNLSIELGLLVRNSDFRSKVTSLAVVRDADQDYQQAFKDVIDALRTAGFSKTPAAPMSPTNGHPRITVMIMPGANLSGSIEDLCLRAFASDTITSCVENHFACLQQLGIKLRSNVLSKAKVRVLLASKSVDELQKDDPVWWVTLAYQKDWWPWSHSSFDEVKTFLNLITSPEES